MIDIPCVIFAGGKSSRMGEDKSLLPFSTYKTLTEFQLHRLSKIFKTVYISTKNKTKFNFQANFIEDDFTNTIYAPTVGFISTFKTIKSNDFFVISVDTPFITEEKIFKIIQNNNQEYDAIIATLEGKMQPLCGIYHRSLEKKFKNMLNENNHKLGFLLKHSNTKFIDFTDKNSFININNPQEYQNALTLIHQHSL